MARNAASVPGQAGTSFRHCTEKLAGHVMTGGIVSRIVMICTHDAELVQSSITVCVRAMVPPQVPPTSAPPLQRYVRLVSQLSLAVPPSARNAARVPGQAGTSLAHCTLKLAGQVMT